jgi:hypothetical protein
MPLALNLTQAYREPQGRGKPAGKYLEFSAGTYRKIVKVDSTSIFLPAFPSLDGSNGNKVRFRASIA